MRKHAIALLLCSTTAHAQPYAEAFAGAAAFDRTVTVGSTKLIDQGGDALLAGARAGYSHRWPSGLYIAGEIEGIAASGRSRAVVNGVTYNYALDGIAGAFTRVGWQMQSGAAFYARAGGQMMFTSQGTQTVPALGIGAQVPFAGPWYARIDITYAWNSTETYQGTVGIGRRF